MLFIVLALALVASARRLPLFKEEEYQTKFAAYVAEYPDKQQYEPQEHEHRYNIFKKNIDHIERHNAGNATYKFGLGPFTDWTSHEFKKMVGGPMKITPEHKRNVVHLDTSNLADAVDWSTKSCGSGNCVTPVKNQGKCGSCWSFSSTGEIESRTAIKTGKLVSLSEQELMDCSKPEGNKGCNGGLMDYAFKYVVKNGGLCLDSDYPYKAKNDIMCRKKCTPVDPIRSFKDVAKDNEAQLAAAASEGPVSVAIEADKAIFQHYKTGVISGMCGTKLDHGVLLVGYGTQGGSDFWKVKNSWGPTWGDRGYVLLEKGKSRRGECGIAMQPSYVIV